MIRELRRFGAEVVVFASQEGLQYVAKPALEWTSLHQVIDQFTSDSEHLSDSAPFDAYLVCPATYNTINKMANGIADSVITSTLASALGKIEQQRTKVLVVPTMHGSMHNRILVESLKKLTQLGVNIVPPRQENGKNNLPEIEILVAAVIQALSNSPLQSKGILITGGSTPVPIDLVRRITNRFTGTLAVEIAKEAYFRGANVSLLLGSGSVPAPAYLRSIAIETYEEYRKTIEKLLQESALDFGIFSAAVADYQPRETIREKIPSGKNQLSLALIPTKKVIREIHEQFPTLTMITFKFEMNKTHEELMEIAQQRLVQGSQIVVANRGEEQGPNGEQVAWIILSNQEPIKAIGKPQIASTLLDAIESLCG